MLAFAAWSLELRLIGKFLFNWPQVVQISNGFYRVGVGPHHALLAETAIYAAAAGWLLIAAAFGYLFRKVLIAYAVWAVYPIAILVVLLFQTVLGLSGYAIVLDSL